MLTDVRARFVRPLLSRRFFAGLPGTPRLWVMLCAASLLTYGFIEVAESVVESGGHAFDNTVGHWLQSFRSATLTQIAINLTALGSSSVLLVFALLAYGVLVAARDRIGLMHLTLALAGAFLLPELLKDYFARDRPDALLHLVSVHSPSFPSGHSFGAAACYATFAFFFARYERRRRLEIFCFALATLVVVTIGMTRVYLGVHYATDVLGGLSAGAAWAFFLDAAFSLGYRKPGAAPDKTGKRRAT
jgi:undecaprenyl-diphosphatase